MTDLFPATLGADVIRFLGVLGFLGYVGLYSCLSLRILHSDSILYFAGNIAAASLVLISLTQDFNLAAAMIQVFWIAMGIPAILLRLRRRRSDRIAAEAAERVRMAKLAAGARPDMLRVSRASPAAAEDRRTPAVSECLVLGDAWKLETGYGRAAKEAPYCRTGTAA